MAGAYKIVTIEGKRYDCPVSELELFTNSVAEKLDIKLSFKLEQNKESPQHNWEFNMTGKLLLPTKELLVINYASDLVPEILEMGAYALNNVFYESHRFRILDNKKNKNQKEAIAITRRSDSKDYDLLYVFENAKDYTKAGSNIGFKKAFDALFDDKASHRRHCGKGKSSSKSIKLTTKDKEMIFLLYERILKQHA